MTDWQVTAKAIYCDAVEDDVVIMVFGDGTLKCTGYLKYVTQANRDTSTILKKKSRALKRDLKCVGPLDFRVTSYRDEILAPEKAA